MVGKRKQYQYFGLAAVVLLLLCGLLNAPKLGLKRVEAPAQPPAPARAYVTGHPISLPPQPDIRGMKDLDPFANLPAAMIENHPILTEGHLGNGEGSQVDNVSLRSGSPLTELFSGLRSTSHAKRLAGIAAPDVAKTQDLAAVSSQAANAPTRSAAGIGNDPRGPVTFTQGVIDIGSYPLANEPILVATVGPVTSSGFTLSTYTPPPSSPIPVFTGEWPNEGTQTSTPSADGHVPEPATTGVMFLLLGCGLAGRWRPKRPKA